MLTDADTYETLVKDTKKKKLYNNFCIENCVTNLKKSKKFHITSFFGYP